LRLPYFWDEAGYYVPAARDILLHGSLIPQTTVSNAHPPLVLAWLALWWKVVGYAPLVTRTAMLVASAFALLGVFRLAERVANTQVAIASTLCTGLYPVFFAQSSLAQVDLCAAGLTFWALSSYVAGDFLATAIWFSLAVLTKETAILAPMSLAGWEIIGLLSRKSSWSMLWSERDATSQGLKPISFSDRNGTLRRASLARARPSTERRALPDSVRLANYGRGAARNVACLVIPTVPLAGWYLYHYLQTGYVFGNPEFFRYNVAGTLSVTRFLLALVMRLWQVLGYMHLSALTLPTFAAMWMLAPQSDSGGERPRIAMPLQMIFYVVVFTYVVAMALIGGAVLARYMLMAVPLVIILCVSTFWRRIRFWRMAIACVALAFFAGWFWNPHYVFSPEDNLAYRDYVELHEAGEHFLEARYPMARVLTAWPASDEVTRPWLGYITRPMRVVRIDNFSLEEVMSAVELRSNYEVALVFSTKYEAGPALWDRLEKWTELKTRFFGFHRDLPASAAAQILGGRIMFFEERKGQWIAVIEMEQVEEARTSPGRFPLQAVVPPLTSRPRLTPLR
jgi:hypothetical protein